MCVDVKLVKNSDIIKLASFNTAEVPPWPIIRWINRKNCTRTLKLLQDLLKYLPEVRCL